jgi:membrane protease subunit HflC
MAVAVGGIVLLLIASFSLFTVRQDQKALVLRLGKIERADSQPGLHWKLPLIESVRKFDARIITMDTERERYLTSEKKNVVVDAFAKWRVADVASYFTSMGGDENRANARISQVLKQELRNQFGRRTIQDVVSGERAQVMDILRVNTAQQVREFGVEVVDVRIKRVDLPEEVSPAVYQRMVAERSRVAKDLRSKGAETAEKITADADRQRTVISAEAYGEAERIRGDGDAKAAEVYAKAYSQDPDFYGFYRSLAAYRHAFKDKGNIMVLEPDSEFFDFFRQATPVPPVQR